MNDGESPLEADRTLTSRYECKYLVNERTADALRDYLAAHAQLDPFSARRDDGRYRVVSLYLDDPGLRLYQDTAQGVRNRYKLRLRYYEERGVGAVFFEVKKRADVIVRKSRGRVTRAEAEEFLRTGSCEWAHPHAAELDEFLDRCRESRALPALRVRYWREAWESRGVDPVRITFDTNVEHCLLSSRGLEERRPDWTPTALDDQVIVELKFTDFRPAWVDQMLRLFQLDKVSVAKYAESIECLDRAGRRRALQARLKLAAEGSGPRSGLASPPGPDGAVERSAG